MQIRAMKIRHSTPRQYHWLVHMCYLVTTQLLYLPKVCSCLSIVVHFCAFLIQNCTKLSIFVLLLYIFIQMCTNMSIFCPFFVPFLSIFCPFLSIFVHFLSIFCPFLSIFCTFFLVSFLGQAPSSLLLGFHVNHIASAPCARHHTLRACVVSAPLAN